MIRGLLSLLDPLRLLKLFAATAYELATFTFRHPTQAAALFATLATLSALYRAYVYIRTWKEARRAAAALQIDAAARWVVAELREHHAAWTRASGSGRQLPAADLRRRIPRDVLTSPGLWDQVRRARGSSGWYQCKRVLPTAYGFTTCQTFKLRQALAAHTTYDSRPTMRGCRW